jgi:hypothetical protein
MDEKRKAPRRAVLKSATIPLAGVRRIICTVRDISKLGVGLVVDAEVAVPNVFKLAIEMESTQRRCRLIWRNGNRLGAMFDA